MTEEDKEKLKNDLAREKRLRDRYEGRRDREAFMQKELAKRKNELLRKARRKEVTFAEAVEYGEILISAGAEKARETDASAAFEKHGAAVTNIKKQIEEAEWDG